MEICDYCTNVMTKKITSVSITYICKCMFKKDGSPEDTLIDEGFTTAQDNKNKMKNFIENTIYDAASTKKNNPCIKCGLPYRALLKIGDDVANLFVCKCGYVSAK